MNYPFGADRIAEHERLIAQGRLFDPLTTRVLREAGLAPGMRVLDLGSGAGNVTRLAAELVGPSGSVLGVDRDPEAVELAARGTAARNAAFRVANIATLEGIDDGFDAVVGRLVLMYTPDPAAALRSAVARVRPGGLVCMHEADLAYPNASPRTPLWAQSQAWFLDALAKGGFDARMGPALFATFLAAGLPGPRLLVEGFAEGGPGAPAWAWANVISAAVPLMEQTGVATRAEVDPSTLASRLLAETLAVGGCGFGPPMIGAWTVLPGRQA
jgi:SAM-dependent methyltransferase